MPKKTVDLFGEADEEEDDDDDEGGAMFSGKASAALLQQDTRANGEEETRPPEKKVCFLIITISLWWLLLVIYWMNLLEASCWRRFNVWAQHEKYTGRSEETPAFHQWRVCQVWRGRKLSNS